ncbi:set1 complex component spp1-like [Thrips palmi]|uniref:Set1 complex component spp1-like n=1 Tax=Thrips palmi TaxID=161013 RepID=A0A6P8YGI0_THRPL|nr:set1 complex component spp1-like [Thrips palmi]
MDHEETAPCPICKGPDEGFQISCDSCLKWYHGRCVGQHKKKNSIWHCPLCCGYWTGALTFLEVSVESEEVLSIEHLHPPKQRCQVPRSL